MPVLCFKENLYFTEKIAIIIGTSQSAVSRELKRNTGQRGYRFKQAQQFTDNRRIAATKAVKMTTSLILMINNRLKKSGVQSKYQVD